MNRTVATLLTAVSALVALGTAMLSSATMFSTVVLKRGGVGLDPWVARQAVAGLAGFAALVAIARLDYRRIERAAPWIYLGALALLGLTLSPLGHASKGAQRWLWGTQPSDFAKPALVLALAWSGAKNAHRLRSFWFGAVAMGAVAAPAILLVLVEPDNGTAALLALITSLVMFVAGVRLIHLVPAALVLAACFAARVQSKGYSNDRWESFIHPEAHPQARLQVDEGLFAFGAGGAEGAGLGRGAFKLKIPEQHTDFILPVVGEELGLPFTLGIVGAYLVILLCGAFIASRAPDRFGQLAAAGVTFLIAAQALVNTCVVTDLIPNKGMPLPFVSRGGSGLVVMLSMVGLLISISSLSPATRTGAATAPNPFAENDNEVPA